MGKKNKKGKKTPAWKTYLKVESGKKWESNKDRKEADKYWNNSAMRQRRPGAAAAHDARSQAYKDQRASNKNRNNKNKNRSNKPSSNQKFDRSSGEFKDIKGALGEDRAAGLQAAEELRDRDVLMGEPDQVVTTPAFPSSLNDLFLQQQESFAADMTQQQEAFNSQLAQQQEAYAVGLAGQLAQQQEAYAAGMTQQQEAFNSQLGSLQDELVLAKDAYLSSNSFMEEQLQASNAARLAAEQRAYNMRNAFVPQANPNALSISYGDQRSTARKKENNQLSDLTILSGVGTTSNPLAGLQLA